MLILLGLILSLFSVQSIRFGPIEPGEELVYLSPNFFQSDADLLTKRDEIDGYKWSFDHFGNSTEAGKEEPSVTILTNKRSSEQSCDSITQSKFGATLADLTHEEFFNGDPFKFTGKEGDLIKCISPKSLIYNEILLFDIELKLTATKSGKLTSFVMKAKWKMDGVKQPMETISFDKDEGLLKFSIKAISDIKPLTVAFHHGIEAGDFSEVFAGSKLEKTMFSRPTINGYFNFKGDFQYVMVSEKNAMKLFITSMETDGKRPLRPIGAFVYEMQPKKNILKDVETKLTFKFKLRDFPLLKHIHDGPWCIVVAPTDISFLGDGMKEEIRKCYPDMNDAKRIIPKGFNIPVSIDFKEAMKECGAKREEFKDLPDVAVFVGKVTMQAIKFEFPADYDVPIAASMTCSGARDLSNLPFNLFISNGDQPILQIKEIAYKPPAAQQQVSKITNKVSPKLSKKIKFDMNEKNKMNIKITVVVTLPKGNDKVPGIDAKFGPFKMHFDELDDATTKWKITGLAQIKFGNGITADVNLEHKFGSSAWKFILKIPSIKLSMFMEKIKDVPNKSGTNLDNIGLQDFQLEWNIEKGEIKPVNVRIRGNPVIAGYSGAHLEGMWWRADDAGKEVEVTHQDTGKKLKIMQPQHGLALGVYFSNINLDWIINKIFGYQLSIPWFSDLKAFLTWTNAASLATPSKECKSKRRKKDEVKPDLKEICFTTPGMGAPIIPDVNAMISWDIPRIIEKDRRCAGEKMCEFMVENLQSIQNIQLNLFYNNANKYFAITAKIKAQITIAENVVLQDILMRIAISLRTPFNFKLMGVLVWRDPDVTASTWRFTGAVELKAKSIGLRFTWSSSDATNTPSKLPISFKKILLGGGYSVAGPYIDLGMEFWVGSSTDHNNLVKVSAFGGYKMDPPSPPKIWFYGKINSLTIDGVCKAFDKNCDKIPKILKESGFNKETTVSVAAADENIEELGLAIPAGFSINGGINILGVEAWGKIINSGKGIEIDINMKPINWAYGLIKIQRNKNDAEKGPKMNVQLNGKPYTYVWIEGYAKIFAFEGEIKLVFQETYAEAILDGPIFFGLKARTQLKATYGNLKALSFKMSIDIYTADFVKDAMKVIERFINEMGKKVQAKLKYLDDKLQTAQGYVVSAKRKANEMKESIQRWRNGLQRELEELKAKENAANTNRCYAKCPKFCVPYPTWKKGCSSYWGWFFGCLTTACSYIRNPICLTKCLAKQIGNAVSTWFTKRKLEIQDWLGARGQDLLDLSVSFLDIGDNWLQILRNLVTKAKTLFKSVTTAMAKFAGGKIFSLDKLKLSARMTNKFDFCGAYKIKCVLFGYNINKKGKSCWRNTFVKDMIFGASEEAPDLKGLSSTEKNLEDVQVDLNTEEEAENEFKKKKNEAEGNTKQQMANEYQKLEKRGKITLQEMEEFAKSLPRDKDFTIDEDKKLIYEPIQRFDSRAKSRSLGIKDMAQLMPDDPSQLMNGVDVTPKKDETVEKRSLVFENDLTPCGRVRKSLEHYQHFTNVLLDNAQSIMDHQKWFEERKKSDIEQLKNLKDQIQNIDERYNMTSEDHRDAWFLYNQAVTVQQDLQKKSKELLEYHKRSALPIIHRQLNFALKEETGSDLQNFFQIVHNHGTEGFKRSDIPSPHQNDGLELLNRMKKDLQSILFEKDVGLNENYDDLINVRSKIERAKAFIHTCS